MDNFLTVCRCVVMFLSKRLVTALDQKNDSERDLVWLRTSPHSSQLTSLKTNQSINQSNIYSASIPGEARLSGVIAKSVFNSKIDKAVPQHQRAFGRVGAYGGGGGQVKEMYFKMILEGSN